MKRDWLLPSGFLMVLLILIVGTTFLPAEAYTIQADVALSPEKINLSNPSDWSSPYMTALITFSKLDRKKIVDIDPSTVLLDGVIPPSKTTLEVYTFKAFFDKGAVINYLWLKAYHLGYIPPYKNKPIVLTVTGNLYDGTPFSGSDTVYVSAR